MDKPTPKADVFQANRDRVAPLLKSLRADGIGHMIDGKIVPSISGETFETKSPVNGATLASVARGNAEDVDRAATSAALAFKSWRDMGPAMRKKLLHRVADAIEDNAEDIAVLECIDTGQAYRFMAKAAVRAAENFRFFADRCGEARDGQNTPSDGLSHHETGRAAREVRAFRAWRPEPRDRVRRGRPGPCAGRRRVHDLLAERRALHPLQPPADPGEHRGKIRREPDRARKRAQG